jgi:DNA-binding NarL/FixJ family response regulator
VCTTQCHANLCAANDHGEVEVRGRHLTMSCTQVGDETIVTLTPCGDVHRWFEQLTKREAEVMRLVACGLQTANIAQTLKVSQSTVRTHVEHARDKLGATTRAEAVARALITGQITL